MVRNQDGSCGTGGEFRVNTLAFTGGVLKFCFRDATALRIAQRDSHSLLNSRNFLQN